MSRTWFSPHVCVESKRSGLSYSVTLVEHAAELLLQDWPIKAWNGAGR